MLDRNKEPGSADEPLHFDSLNALHETGRDVGVVGGRYGLSSKEFTPAMIMAVFDNLAAPEPKKQFTIGIDDPSGTSLDFDASFSVKSDNVFRALFYCLRWDGPVRANEDSIKIIGDRTANYAHGYFVYDSKKDGAVTMSHLRFGPRPIRSSYLISEPQFVGCHQPFFLEYFDVLGHITAGGVFLLNTPSALDRVRAFSWSTPHQSRA